MNILVGDAAEHLSALGVFDLVVTDPPYAGSRRRGGVTGGGASWRSRHRSAAWPEQEYAMTENVLAVVTEAATHVRVGGHMAIVCGSAGRAVEAMIHAVTVPHLPLMRVLPWIQPSNKNGAIGPFGWQSQLVLVFGKNYRHPRAEGFLIVDRHYNARGRREARLHPAQMPAAVGRWLARAMSDPGTTVLDIEPRWADLARRRLAELETPHDLWPAAS